MPKVQLSTLFFNVRRSDGLSAFGVRQGRFTDPDGQFDQEVNLAGAFVMPSFGDGHTHPLFAGRELGGPEVTGLTDLPAILAAVQSFAKANPDKEWIVGGTYDRTLGSKGSFQSSWLDAAVPDRPVVLHASDHHTLWVNGEAMRRAGISKSTPDCATGIIERSSDGEPSGTFREWDATNLILSKIPGLSLSDEIDSLARAADQLASVGVTWWQEAWIDRGMTEIYLATSKAGKLNQDVDLAFRADPNSWREDFEYFISMRQEVDAYQGENELTARTIKFFTDGVIEGGTALLLEAYLDEPDSHGMPVWTREELFNATIAADLAGFQLHLHAIGDGGVRLALDAIENVKSVNPDKPRRPVIAHVQLVAEDDLYRFAELGVIANFTPVWTCLDPEQDVLCTPRIGQQRSDQQYRMKSLLTSGARISFGSDWPVSTPAPFKGLPTSVHRRSTSGQPANGWLMHEALNLDQAIKAYTSGVAYQGFAEHRWGDLKQGMDANFLVLDQDPRQLPIDQVAELQIQATYLRGQPIFQRR